MIEPTYAIVEPYQRPAITARGVAALRLAEFEDRWNELTTADKAWFREWLADIFASAFVEAPASTA
jgi:hypothetical protein